MPCPSVVRSQPSGAPRHRLDGGFAAQRAAAAVAQRPAAEIDHVGLAVLRFDEVGVAGALQLDVGPVARAQDVDVGMQFVRPGQRARARHGDGMPPAGAALGGEQVVVAVALVEMRRLGEAERRALEDQAAVADQLALAGGVFLQHDAGETVVPGPMVPEHVDEIFAAVVVVEQRGIEAAAVEVNRVRPLAVDARAGDQVVVEIAQRRARSRRRRWCGRSASRRCR